MKHRTCTYANGGQVKTHHVAQGSGRYADGGKVDGRPAPPPPPPKKDAPPPKKSEMEGTLDAIKARKALLDSI